MSVLSCSIIGWLADVAVYQAHTVATLKKIIVQISALEPVTIIFFWKHTTLIMVEKQ